MICPFWWLGVIAYWAQHGGQMPPCSAVWRLSVCRGVTSPQEVSLTPVTVSPSHPLVAYFFFIGSFSITIQSLTFIFFTVFLSLNSSCDFHAFFICFMCIRIIIIRFLMWKVNFPLVFHILSFLLLQEDSLDHTSDMEEVCTIHERRKSKRRKATAAP